jgi:predicted DNA-binding WGR domain protein
MKRELIYMDAKSSKFWNIELAGNTHIVHFGRIGTDGQKITKTFRNETEAQNEFATLVKEKLAKGYADAASSGASIDARSSGAPDWIPFAAFSSINRKEEIGENVGTFVGHRVIDYDRAKPDRPDVVYRFRSDWDKDELLPNLEHFLASPGGREAKAIVIGAWHGGDDSDRTPEGVIDFLVRSKDQLPELAAIYVGDITSEENGMSWINQCDLSPLLKAYPKLQLLRSRGGQGLQLSEPFHQNLRALALETGGMDVTVVRAVCTSEFPNLEYLELWLGTDEYGLTATVADLQPILSGRLFPRLRYLGLRNCQFADEMAGVVVNSPILDRIEILDLSLGVLTDEGGEALTKLAPTPSLKRLNLHYNYLSADMIRRLKALPLTVDASKPSDMDDEDEWRFVAVGE